MNISIHLYILSVTGLALLGLGIWIRHGYQNSLAIHYYSAFLFSLAAMAIISGLAFFPFSPSSMLWVDRFGYFFGLVTFCMLLMFSFYFPIPNKNISERIRLIYIVPIAVLGTLILTSQLFLQDVSGSGISLTEHRGSLYWLFPVFIMLSMIFTLTNFFRKNSLVQGKASSDLRMITIMLIVASLLGLIFDVLWPALGGPRLFIGVYSTALLFAISTYIVYRK